MQWGEGRGGILSQHHFGFILITEVEKHIGRKEWHREENSHEIKQCTILNALKAFPLKMHFSVWKTLS